MAGPGYWGQFPVEMGGSKARAEAIYETLVAGRGEGHFTTDFNADCNVDLQATAWAIADAEAYQEIGALQAQPQFATGLLVEWERALGRTPDTSETRAQRRATLDAILAGNGEPIADNIAAALSKALDGETVVVRGSYQDAPAFGGTNTIAPTIAAASSGGLAAGVHYVSLGWTLANGVKVKSTASSSVTLSAGQRIKVAEAPLPLVATAACVHYYLSVKAGSTSMAWVASGNGCAVDLCVYPTPPPSIPLCHYAIVVSNATWGDTVKRRKIDQILGAMLPGVATWTVCTSLSGMALGSSPLGKAAF